MMKRLMVGIFLLFVITAASPAQIHVTDPSFKQEQSQKKHTGKKHARKKHTGKKRAGKKHTGKKHQHKHHHKKKIVK